MTKMKKMIISFVVLMLIGIITIVLIVAIGIKTSQTFQSIKIVSNFENQIQDINEFRLDKIVVDVQIDNDKHQNLVLKPDMLVNKDEDFNQLGYHQVSILYQGLKLIIPIFIYDDEYLKSNYIYYYQMNETWFLDSRESIFFLPTPTKKGYYFYGWYEDSIGKNEYIDGEKRIVEIFPMWATDSVYKIDFYLQNKIIKRSYVLAEEIIAYPKVEMAGFYGWDYFLSSTNKDLDIYGIVLKENEIVVRFFSKNYELLEYRIISKGESIKDYPKPALEDHVFYSWSENLNQIYQSIDCYPIYISDNETFNVNFYNVSGTLLETKQVKAGESTSYDNKNNDSFYVSGYSQDLGWVVSEMNVVVYFKPYIFKYYVDEQLYKFDLSTNEAPSIPNKEGYVASWEKRSDTEFYAKYLKIGEYFVFKDDENNQEIMIPYVELNLKELSSQIISMTKKLFDYDWYYDSEFKELIHWNQLKELKDHIVTVYGKVKKHKRTEVYGKVEAYETGGKMVKSYLSPTYFWLENVYMQNGLIPYDIISVDFSCFINSEYVFIGEEIKEISGIDQSLTTKIKAFIVSDNNPYYYSLDGNLYDKKTNELLYGVGK